MKLKVKPREAEIIRNALAARVNIMLTLGRHPRNHEARKQKAEALALLDRLFPTEEKV